MRKMTDSVVMHADWGEEYYPSIDVKLHRFDFPDLDDVAAELGIGPNFAEKLLERAFECMQETFWEDSAEKIVKRHFPKATMYCCGRSAGWLSLGGLSDPIKWGVRQREHWQALHDDIRDEIRFLLSKDQMVNLIRANKWEEENE